MNKIYLVMAAMMCFCTISLYAQYGGNQNQNRFRQRRSNMRMNEETAKKWANIQKELKKKHPKKFAQIEKLAQTNLPKAMQEMTRLAQSSGMELPRNNRNGNFRRFRQGGFGGGMRRMGGQDASFAPNHNSRVAVEEQLKTKYPAEYAKIAKLRDDAEAKMQALAKKGNLTLPDTAETTQRKFRLVREKYKAEFDEIAKLRQTDPRAAWERTMEIYKKEGLSFPRFGGGMQRMGGQGNMPRMQDPPPPPRRSNPVQERMALLRKTYPAEMKKIDSLRRTDPAAYRRELRAIAKRYQLEQNKKK